MSQKSADGSMRKAVGGLVSAVNWVSLASLCLMMFLTVSDVIGRYLFNRPLVMAQDVTELLMILVVFMAIPYTQFVKGHIRVGLLTSRLPEHTQAILDSATSFLGAAIFAFIAWQLGKRAWVSLLNPGLYFTLTVEIPIGPFVLIAAIGSFMLCLMFLTDFLSCLVRASSKQEVV